MYELSEWTQAAAAGVDELYDRKEVLMLIDTHVKDARMWYAMRCRFWQGETYGEIAKRLPKLNKQGEYVVDVVSSKRVWSIVEEGIQLLRRELRVIKRIKEVQRGEFAWTRSLSEREWDE